ncbi:MAG: ISAs1 family transposase [Plectolyngbya sp. WJT66-NPBG17]|nr:ISAs1 family transposase [Plectolyngbya sp. WJT66-NPBG17]MBW4528375.1 ISAs1 family transposase [Phormidium tanganyikae FI6-MK23]
MDDQTEQTRNRMTHRTISVLDPVDGIDAAWVGVQRLVRVERTGIRGVEATHETMFYISSVAGNATDFSRLIRDHWHIENRLHWVKDVFLEDDITPVCAGHAPENMAILRTIALNLFRLHGFASITKALRAFAHDIPRLFSFCQ